MGRAEEAYFNNIARQKVEARELSERTRILCLDVLVPHLIELGREFLEKQEAADFPIPPTDFSVSNDAAAWKVGGDRDGTLLLSDGRVFIPFVNDGGMSIAERYEPYDFDEHPERKFDSFSENLLRGYIKNVQGFIDSLDDLATQVR